MGNVISNWEYSKFLDYYVGLFRDQEDYLCALVIVYPTDTSAKYLDRATPHLSIGSGRFDRDLTHKELSDDERRGNIRLIRLGVPPVNISWSVDTLLDPMQESRLKARLYDEDGSQYQHLASYPEGDVSVYLVKMKKPRYDEHGYASWDERGTDEEVAERIVNDLHRGLYINIYWRGTLDPEGYTEPYAQDKGYIVEIEASDFGMLKRQDTLWRGNVPTDLYAIDDRALLDSRELVMDLCYKLLMPALPLYDRAQIEQPETVCTWSAIRWVATDHPEAKGKAGSNPDAGKLAYVSTIPLLPEKAGDKPQTRYEALEKVLRSLGMQLRQRGGRFVFADLDSEMGSAGEVYSIPRSAPAAMTDFRAVETPLEVVDNDAELSFVPTKSRMQITTPQNLRTGLVSGALQVDKPATTPFPDIYEEDYGYGKFYYDLDRGKNEVTITDQDGKSYKAYALIWNPGNRHAYTYSNNKTWSVADIDKAGDERTYSIRLPEGQDANSGELDKPERFFTAPSMMRPVYICTMRSNMLLDGLKGYSSGNINIASARYGSPYIESANVALRMNGLDPYDTPDSVYPEKRNNRFVSRLDFTIPTAREDSLKFLKLSAQAFVSYSPSPMQKIDPEKLVAIVNTMDTRRPNHDIIVARTMARLLDESCQELIVHFVAWTFGNYDWMYALDSNGEWRKVYASESEWLSRQTMDDMLEIRFDGVTRDWKTKWTSLYPELTTDRVQPLDSPRNTNHWYWRALDPNKSVPKDEWSEAYRTIPLPPADCHTVHIAIYDTPSIANNGECFGFTIETPMSVRLYQAPFYSSGKKFPEGVRNVWRVFEPWMTPNFVLVRDVQLDLVDEIGRSNDKISSGIVSTYVYSKMTREQDEVELLYSDGNNLHPASPTSVRSADNTTLASAMTPPSKREGYRAIRPLVGGTFATYIANAFGYLYGDGFSLGGLQRMKAIAGTFSARPLAYGLRTYQLPDGPVSFLPVAEEYDVQTCRTTSTLHEVPTEIRQRVIRKAINTGGYIAPRKDSSLEGSVTYKHYHSDYTPPRRR